MRQNPSTELWSAEEIGFLGKVAGELERLAENARHSETTYLRGIDTLSQNIDAVNKRLADLERGFDKKQRAREQKLQKVLKELESLGNEPPALRKETFNLWWVRFRKALDGLEEAVSVEEM